MTNIFVSAIYDIYESTNELRSEYHTFLWKKAAELGNLLPNLHICCSDSDYEHFKSLYPHLTLYNLNLVDTKIWNNRLENSELPTYRNMEKDTHNYLLLINTKTEFVKHIKKFHDDARFFTWIDAGILKVIKNPSTLTSIKNKEFPNNQVTIPGPSWSKCDSVSTLTTKVWWRFCGGLFIVPSALVDDFADENLRCLCEMRAKTGRITWEVNVWAYIESQGRLNIAICYGDHNDSIFSPLLLAPV